MSARQVLIRALGEQLGKGASAVAAFAASAASTAGLAALAGPALQSLDHASTRSAPGTAGPFAALQLTPLQVLLAAVVLMLVNAGSRYVGTLMAGAVQQRVVRNLRIHLHDHLLHLASTAWAALGPGELASRLGAEVAAIRSLVHIVISHTLQHLLVAAALATLAMQLDTRVATFALLMVAPLATAAWWLSRAARPATLAVHEAEARVAELAGEHGALVPLVRAYGAESYASDQLRQAAERSETAVLAALVAHQRVGPSLEVLAAGLSFGALVWFRAGVQLPLATAVSLFVALMLMLRPLQALASSIPAAYAGLGSLERLEQLLALPRIDPSSRVLPSASEVTSPSIGERGDSVLALRAVDFAYAPGQPVLHGITLALRAGERVALTGRSGEGKSTLLMLLAGLLPPDRGVREVDGVPCAEACEGVAWVPQDSLFFADSLLANIAFGAPQDRTRALEVLGLVGLDALVASLPEGLDTLLAGRGRQLSGGERQRLSIARGLYRHPRVLLLDEVTSALDAESEAEVLSALSSLAASGTAMVFVSHRPSVAAFAERVLTLDGGRVVSDRAP